MEARAAILHTADLAIGYHGRTLLGGLNLTLERGRLICFMGPNGIGKSTLIRTLAGLQKPISGTVTVTPGKFQKASVSLVLTDRITASYMTVAELVSFGRYPYLHWNIKLSTTDRDIIRKSIEQVNIAGLADRRLHELSDGQLQLAMIARALAQDSDIILLDEPTAHLDLNNRLEIMNLLRSLAHNMDKAILVATHELDLALQTADEIWLAGNDSRVLAGLPEDLVLNGAFDSIFQLKGFDLKTGKVLHMVSRLQSVNLSGDGYEYRWTRNALERAGYEVTEDKPRHMINVRQKDGIPVWSVDNSHDFYSIGHLLTHLEKVST